MLYFAVEAYTALWIEIKSPCTNLSFAGRRGLYSLVDWNNYVVKFFLRVFRRGLYSLVDWNKYDFVSYLAIKVEAYTALWIEIKKLLKRLGWMLRSRLIQPCGLKYEAFRMIGGLNRRGLYSLVDWNNYDAGILHPVNHRGLYSLMD